MATLKWIDCAAQIMLAVFALIWFCVRHNEDDDLLGFACALTGNIASCLIHAAVKYDRGQHLRRSEYNRRMLQILAIGAASWVFGGVIKFYLYGLILVFPFTTYIYIDISMKEIHAQNNAS